MTLPSGVVSTEENEIYHR